MCIRDRVNSDDTASPAAPSGLPVISFTLGEPASPRDFGVVCEEGERIMVQGETALGRVSDMALQGDQNVANMLAAMALLDAAGVALSGDAIRAGLNYGGLPHRCEVVTEVGGVKWINDSKGTNVGATVAAISGINAPIVLIAGGKGKGADFSRLASAIHRSVSHTILLGEDADTIANTLSPDDSWITVGSLEDAIAEADKRSQTGGVVLFSPACASFDMFDNYEQRGNVFKQLVLERVH